MLNLNFCNVEHIDRLFFLALLQVLVQIFVNFQEINI